MEILYEPIGIGFGLNFFSFFVKVKFFVREDAKHKMRNSLWVLFEILFNPVQLKPCISS